MHIYLASLRDLIERHRVLILMGISASVTITGIAYVFFSPRKVKDTLNSAPISFRFSYN